MVQQASSSHNQMRNDNQYPAWFDLSWHKTLYHYFITLYNKFHQLVGTWPFVLRISFSACAVTCLISLHCRETRSKGRTPRFTCWNTKSNCVFILWLDTVVRRCQMSFNYNLFLTVPASTFRYFLWCSDSPPSHFLHNRQETENSGAFKTHLFFIPLMLHGE